MAPVKAINCLCPGHQPTSSTTIDCYSQFLRNESAQLSKKPNLQENARQRKCVPTQHLPTPTCRLISTFFGIQHALAISGLTALIRKAVGERTNSRRKEPGRITETALLVNLPKDCSHSEPHPHLPGHGLEIQNPTDMLSADAPAIPLASMK